MSYEDSIERSISKNRTLEDHLQKDQGGGLAKFVNTLASVDSKSTEAKKNETSISDNNGGRIKLNEGKSGRSDIVGNQS